MSDTSSNKDFDLSMLYEIADGSNEFIIESITMFLDQSPGLLQAIDDAIAAKDWQGAASAAHKIKANLGFFGMLNSHELIQEVESLCKAGGENPGTIMSKFNEVKSIMAENLVALAHIKAEKEADL